jgi:hypothetical protein
MPSQPVPDNFVARFSTLPPSRSVHIQFAAVAAIAQLGERQTEDLKVPGSIPGLGIFFGTGEQVNHKLLLFSSCHFKLVPKFS